MTESKTQTKILQKLKFHKDCIWSVRLNSGKMGSYMLAPAGTPDVLAFIDQGNGNIAALFLEVKKPGVKRLRYEQKQFFKIMEGKPKIMCSVINDVDKLGSIIRKAKDI